MTQTTEPYKMDEPHEKVMLVVLQQAVRRLAERHPEVFDLEADIVTLPSARMNELIRYVIRLCWDREYLISLLPNDG